MGISVGPAVCLNTWLCYSGVLTSSQNGIKVMYPLYVSPSSGHIPCSQHYGSLSDPNESRASRDPTAGYVSKSGERVRARCFWFWFGSVCLGIYLDPQTTHKKELDFTNFILLGCNHPCLSWNLEGPGRFLFFFFFSGSQLFGKESV